MLQKPLAYTFNIIGIAILLAVVVCHLECWMRVDSFDFSRKSNWWLSSCALTLSSGIVGSVSAICSLSLPVAVWYERSTAIHWRTRPPWQQLMATNVYSGASQRNFISRITRHEISSIRPTASISTQNMSNSCLSWFLFTPSLITVLPDLMVPYESGISIRTVHPVDPLSAGNLPQ